MPWYSYQLGGWQIAVDAINAQDAHKHIAIHARDAQYKGVFSPPSMANPSMATAMTTARRQEQISAAAERDYQEYLRMKEKGEI